MSIKTFSLTCLCWWRTSSKYLLCIGGHPEKSKYHTKWVPKAKNLHRPIISFEEINKFDWNSLHYQHASTNRRWGRRTQLEASQKLPPTNLLQPVTSQSNSLQSSISLSLLPIELPTYFPQPRALSMCKIIHKTSPLSTAISCYLHHFHSIQFLHHSFHSFFLP